jgi:hypothetical protein
MPLEFGGGVSNLRQPGAHLPIKPLAGRRQQRLPDASLKQQHAQMFFKQFDVSADRTVADMQLFGRQGEALMTSSDSKGANSIKRR